MVDNTPDFDNMSEEEIMNWMESLARRAGATEGFTTSADMDIAEIDPDSVVIDEPGYVPYSERSSDSTARMPAQPPPPPEPIIEEITIEEADLAADSPPTAETGSLDWLESLAADQSDSLFNLDLSAIEVAGAPVEAPAPRVNPEAWLQNLTQSQGESVLGGSESEDEGDTLEWLETHGVPVLGWQTDEFPAFYSRDSGLGVDLRVEGAADVAQVWQARRRLGLGGVLLTVPIPEEHATPAATVEAAITAALDEADARGVRGKAVTPFLLERVAALTEGASQRANLALLEHNARVAALVASSIAEVSRG